MLRTLISLISNALQRLTKLQLAVHPALKSQTQKPLSHPCLQPPRLLASLSFCYQVITKYNSDGRFLTLSGWSFKSQFRPFEWNHCRTFYESIPLQQLVFSQLLSGRLIYLNITNSLIRENTACVRSMG